LENVDKEYEFVWFLRMVLNTHRERVGDN